MYELPASNTINPSTTYLTGDTQLPPWVKHSTGVRGSSRQHLLQQHSLHGATWNCRVVVGGGWVGGMIVVGPAGVV